MIVKFVDRIGKPRNQYICIRFTLHAEIENRLSFSSRVSLVQGDLTDGTVNAGLLKQPWHAGYDAPRAA